MVARPRPVTAHLWPVLALHQSVDGGGPAARGGIHAYGGHRSRADGGGQGGAERSGLEFADNALLSGRTCRCANSRSGTPCARGLVVLTPIALMDGPAVGVRVGLWVKAIAFTAGLRCEWLVTPACRRNRASRIAVSASQSRRELPW